MLTEEDQEQTKITRNRFRLISDAGAWRFNFVYLLSCSKYFIANNFVFVRSHQAPGVYLHNVLTVHMDYSLQQQQQWSAPYLCEHNAAAF